MKILHTSDWHIGHKLYNNDRTEEHQHFFSWLVDTINSEAIDVLLVCGDIFDVGYPSNLALKTYYQLLRELVKSRCGKVIITGGNHDFVSTLEAPREVLEVLNVEVIGGVPEDVSKELIKLMNEQGDLEVVIAAVPFLREKDVRSPVAGESSEDRIRATRQGILDHYQRVAGLAAKIMDKNIPVIATGHLYMQGAQLSESERDIHLGNQAGVPVSGFPDAFSYFALGHIHRAQTVSEDPPVIYSGSPIALSFSEQHNKKSVRIISVDNGRVSHEKMEVPQVRKLRSFSGTFDEVTGKVREYVAAGSLPDWIEILITQQEYDPLLPRMVDQFVDETNRSDRNFEIIRHTIAFAERNMESYLTGGAGKSLNDMTETEVFERLLENQGITETETYIRSFQELLDIVYSEQDQDQP